MLLEAGRKGILVILVEGLVALLLAIVRKIGSVPAKEMCSKNIRIVASFLLMDYGGEKNEKR